MLNEIHKVSKKLKFYIKRLIYIMSMSLNINIKNPTIKVIYITMLYVSLFLILISSFI